MTSGAGKRQRPRVRTEMSAVRRILNLEADVQRMTDR